MNIIDKYNCILCKYNKYNRNGRTCWDYREKDEYGYPLGECNSLSNIYYGKIIKLFPFKQLDKIKTNIYWKISERNSQKLDKKYGDYVLENDEYKFIWGIKSYDDLSQSDANFFTMNDIYIVYNKKTQQYELDIETAYLFKDYEAECKYLKGLLSVFTNYMNENSLYTNKNFGLFMKNPSTSMVADNIEELYTNFKVFVNGYCSLKGDK